MRFSFFTSSFHKKKAKYVYTAAANVVGDTSPLSGFARHKADSTPSSTDKESKTSSLKPGERNEDIDVFFFGTRYFCGEPLVVPKTGGDRNNETEAYLLGMAHDSARDNSFLAVFDLERPLADGPVCKLWFKGSIPHGLHGCFDPNSDGKTSYFC